MSLTLLLRTKDSAPVDAIHEVSEGFRPFAQTKESTPPRLLMIVESAAGGTGRHVLDLCEGLIARGCDVHLVYSTGRVDRMFMDRLSTVHGLKTASLRMRTSIHPSDAAVVLAIRRYLREHGPFDAVHGHSSKGGALARLVAFGTGIPSFYTLHGFIIMDPGLARWKRALYLAIEIGLSRMTNAVIAVSPEEARAAVRFGLGRARVTVVPNGIGNLDLTPRHEARRAIGVSDDATVVGFVGRLVDQKAPDNLLRGFANAARAVPASNLTLAMVGSGPLESSLRSLSESLGVSDRVHWLGERDARGVLSGFDLFALASRKEGLPYVVIEAMAAGLPVVATTSAGVEILVDQGVTGTVVPPDDADSIGRALAELAGDGNLIKRFGAAARARSALFTTHAMVQRTLMVYQGIGSTATDPTGMSSTTASADRLLPRHSDFWSGDARENATTDAQLDTGSITVI